MIKLSDDKTDQLLEAIKKFFDEELEIDVGDLKALRILDFAREHLGPTFYNQAVSDVQGYMSERVADLDGVFFEAEPKPE